MKNKAIFAGSFDPISLAHIDILKKSESLFSKVYLCVSKNIAKKPLFTNIQYDSSVTEHPKIVDVLS